MRKAIIYLAFIVSILAIFTFLLGESNRESEEVVRLATENYKLRNDILRLKNNELEFGERNEKLKDELEMLQAHLIQLTELKDFEHYKSIKSQLQDNKIMAVEHSASTKQDNQHGEMNYVFNIDSSASFEGYIELLAKEELIVIDHVTKILSKSIIENDRNDEFLEYIYNFRVRTTTEESYSLKRLEYLLMP